MRRLLDKLRRKNGSVLFLVVVVMSLLIIAASATYYVVSNQSSAIGVKYSSEQSYQSAMSICNAISDFIDGYGIKLQDKQIDGTGYTDNILVKLVNLPAGNQFDATQDFTSLGLGDVEITISKPYEPVQDENGYTVHTIDITTKATVNGESTTTTLRKAISVSEQVQTAEPFTRFLTSTGKGSDARDVYLAPAQIYGDAFFENEWTTMSAELHCSLYSSRSFTDYGVKYYRPDNIKNWEFVVAENFYARSNSSHSREKLDNVLIGGNMYLNSQWNAEKVYVLGNLEVTYNDSGYKNTFYIAEDCYIKANSIPDDTFYVVGNLYYEYTLSGTYYISDNSKVYSNNVEINAANFPSNITVLSESKIEEAMYNKIPQNNFVSDNPDLWGESDYFPITDWESVKAYINQKSSKNEYMVWDAEGYFLQLESEGKTAGTITPNKDNSYITPKWNAVCEITKSCRLKQADFKNGDYSISGSIVIKATTEPIYIYLEPENGESFFQFGKTDYITNVIIEGQFPVVFVLPSGCDFIMNNHSFIGHADLAIEMGGMSSVDEMLDCQNNNIFAYCHFNTADAAKIKSLFTEDSDGFLKYNTTGKTGSLHNNIFLVSKSDGSTFDFSKESTFAGYIYAPYCNLKSDASSQSIAFVGGIVVSNYTYKNNQAVLVFTSPYDYYDNFKDYDFENGETKGDIANKLMAASGGKKPGSDKGNITVVGNVQTIGFN